MTLERPRSEHSDRTSGEDRFHPAFWVFLAGCSFLAVGYLAFIGHLAPGLHIDETCQSAGQPLDDEYRQQAVHSQLFPISYPCNEQFNLVPWWINPLIALLTTVFTTVCAVATVTFVLTFTRRIIASCGDRHQRARTPWSQRLPRTGPSHWIGIAICALVAIPVIYVGAYLLTGFSAIPWWANALIILAASLFAVASLLAVVTSLVQRRQARRGTR